MKLVFFTTAFALCLAACNSLPSQTTSERHISEKPATTAKLTPPSLRPIRLPAMPPLPTPRAAQEVFSVVVNDVPIKTLLFALARDNRLNIDIHPSVSGRVTLNATDQTLQQLLERIAAQSDIRYEISGDLLRVRPDTPYLQNYSIDYVNLLREASSQVSVNSSLGNPTGSRAGSSDASIKTTSDNKFWDTLVSNICQIVVASNQVRNQRDEQVDQQRLRDQEDRLKVALELSKAAQGSSPSNTPTSGAGGATTNNASAADLMRQVLNLANNTPATPSPAAGAPATGTPAGAIGSTTAVPAAAPCGASTGGSPAAGGSSNPLMVNKEAGIIGINTTSKGHDRVRAFVDRVMSGARRQVLIEATVVEVQLSATSQSGINWSQLITTGAARGLTINLTPSSSLPALSTGNISLNRTGTVIGDINAAVSLLESFGTTKVLSSPKLSVINNQTAIIKVIDNYVYVTIAYTPPVLSASGNNVVSPGAYVSTINTVPIGFVMTVTPQIADSDQVTLNVHPSITRVIGTINDPAPALANNTQVTNLIPVVQSREMESILRVQSGEIAVLGGLMQESSTNNDQGIPGVARNTFGGALTGARSEVRAKTELVIFMRPIVIKDASVNGDYKEFKPQLPTSSFFNEGSANTWGVKK